MVKLPNDERVVVVALGESGSGKSHLLNLLLNSPGEQVVFFPEGDGAEPCTTHPKEEGGRWRGDPMRPLLLVDSPGMGGGPQADLASLLHTAKLLKEFSYINSFLIVLAAGQARFLSQHRQMLEAFQIVFGSTFWQHVLLVVTEAGEELRASTNRGSTSLHPTWLTKLREQIPAAATVPLHQVHIASASHESDTLEDFWLLCSGLPQYSCSHFLTDKDDVKLSSLHESKYTPPVSPLPPSISPAPPPFVDLLRPLSSLSGRSSRSSNHELGNLLDWLPPLPAPSRSPVVPRRRYSQQQLPRSLTLTPRLPRNYMPSLPSSDDLSFSRHSASSTPRTGRRSFNRETSPFSHSFSCRTSRETSPSSGASASNFKTVGIPTYLRTCSAYKIPFTKAMRASRLQVSHATEDHIILDKADENIPPLPPLEDLDAIFRLPCDLVDLVCVGQQGHSFLPSCRPTVPIPAPCDALTAEAVTSWEPPTLFRLSQQDGEWVEPDLCSIIELTDLGTISFIARRSSVERSELELIRPDSVCSKHLFNLVKKALLPRVKYHWDQGFRQGPTGWQKVPLVKIKIKYNEEDADLLPKYISVEGGPWSESRRVRLEGCKAKVKLRLTQRPEIQLRGVPLDKDLKQEAWVPEFLFSILSAPPAAEGEEEKWTKATVLPSMPE